MKKILTIPALILFSVTFLLLVPSEAQLTGGTWSFTTESVNLGLTGVSPHAEKLPSGVDRLYFASEAALPDPIMVQDCSDAGTCTRLTLGSRFGSDATIVTLNSGARKAFFVEMGPAGKKIRFATVNSDGLSHGTVSDLKVDGSSVPQTELAWGVPDAIVLPDGKVRIYWVLVDQATGKPGLPEAIVSATSTDATATDFVRDPGLRLTGGYVDPEILRAKDGDWVMITSTGPGAGTQYLYMATSSDGLTWNLNTTPITTAAQSALDPTGYEIGTNTWRIYYASTIPGLTVNRTYTIKRAILSWKEAAPTPPVTLAPSAVPSATPSATPSSTQSNPTVIATPSISPTVAKNVAKSITITCVKGKTTKKVSGTNPKCPAGYKKK